MDEDDRRSGELVPTRDPAADVRTVVDEQLEVELGREAAGVAVAARRQVDAPEASTKGDVGGLDRIEKELALGATVLDEQEGGVALELRQPEWRIEPPDDRFEQVARDDRGVLDLAARDVGRIAGEVRDQKETSLG